MAERDAKGLSTARRLIIWLCAGVLLTLLLEYPVRADMLAEKWAYYIRGVFTGLMVWWVTDALDRGEQ